MVRQQFFERVWVRLVTVVIVAAVAVFAGSLAPVGAAPNTKEVVASPRWGVAGLRTQTLTDSIRSPVFSITQAGPYVVVGGRFLVVTDGLHSIDQGSIAAFDAVSRRPVVDWGPELNGAVYSVAASPDGRRVFVGGDFTTVDGVTTGPLVALDAATGKLDVGWSGRVGGYSLVRSVEVTADGWVYAAGGFSSASSASTGGTAAFRIARFAAADGTLDVSWRPEIMGGSVWDVAVDAGENRVYAAGYFTSVNSEHVRQGFAVLHGGDGSLVPVAGGPRVNTTDVARQYSYAVEVTDKFVWVAGSEHFVQVLHKPGLGLHRFYYSDGQGGDYQVLEAHGNHVYAGCHCRHMTSVLRESFGVLWFGGQGVNAPVTFAGPNTWLSVFDADTGMRDRTFVPPINTSGSGVWGLHHSDTGCLWVGGAVTRAGGVPQHGFTVMCDPAAIDTDRPSTPGRPVLHGIGGDGSVSLWWNPATDNVGVTQYRVFDADGGVDALFDSAVNEATVSLLEGSYRLYTRAYDAAGNESWRSGYTLLRVDGPADTVRPTTPAGLRSFRVGAGVFELSWQPSTDNVGVAGYRVFRADGSEFATVSSGNVLRIETETGLSLYVRAYDQTGNLSWRSNIVSLSP